MSQLTNNTEEKDINCHFLIKRKPGLFVVFKNKQTNKK